MWIGLIWFRRGRSKLRTDLIRDMTKRHLNSDFRLFKGMVCLYVHESRSRFTKLFFIVEQIICFTYFEDPPLTKTETKQRVSW